MKAQDFIVIVGVVLWTSLRRILGEAVVVQTTLGKIEGLRRRDDYGLGKLMVLTCLSDYCTNRVSLLIA
jgi:hypothetical protein